MPEDAQKIDGLKKLLAVVTENTKLNLSGKAGKPATERLAGRAVLKALLGRAPSEEELASLAV